MRHAARRAFEQNLECVGLRWKGMNDAPMSILKTACQRPRPLYISSHTRQVRIETMQRGYCIGECGEEIARIAGLPNAKRSNVLLRTREDRPSKTAEPLVKGDINRVR